MFNHKTMVLSIATVALLATGCTQTATPKTEAKTAPVAAQKTSDGSFTLPNAKSGTCYGKVVIPAQYKTVTERIKATPEDTKLSIVPATYKQATERVLDTPASTKIVAIPATYKTERKTVTVSPAYTEWRTGLHPEARVASSAVLASAKAGGVNLEAAKAGSCYYLILR